MNKLSDKLAVCDQSMIYEEEEVERFNQKYWSGAPREEIDPILDVCVQRFEELSDTDDNNQQIEVKSAMKQFVRLYEFLTALMDIQRIDWEKKNTFFHFLLRKLPKIGKEDWTEGLLDLVDFDKYRVVKGEDRKIKLENVNATVDPIPVGDAGTGGQDPNLETLERIVDDFNLVFGDIEWGDPDTVRQQIRQVVTKLQENDEVRDSMLNNDEETQIQVIHDNISNELGIITANSSEMGRRYMSQPSIQAQLDNLIFMRLQEQLNPEINEQILSEKLLEEFAADFKELCGSRLRPLEEGIEWFFKVLDTPTISSLDGIKKIKRTINLVYRTQGREEDKQDWLQQILGRFEAYMKKIYYMSHQIELMKADGRFVQFLDAAKAVRVNQLHFTVDPKLEMMKAYYEFVHAQRNEESHNAPIIADEEVSVGLHMAMAMYLYATLINIPEMEGQTGEHSYMMKDVDYVSYAADSGSSYSKVSDVEKES